MSFINNLAKGFIRSAVNQVGRDGGKVISNQIYKGGHTTPINSQGYLYNSDKPIPLGLVDKKEYIYIKWIWAIVISFIIPFLGSFLILYRGIVNIKKKYMIMLKIENKPRYTPDRRYNSGVRQVGYVRVETEVRVNITDKKIKQNKIKSIGYFIISGLMFLNGIRILITLN